MKGPVEELEKTWELCQQIDFAPSKGEFESGLLEPTANFLCAETATFRVFSGKNARPNTVIGLGISNSVHDAYLNHYYKLDPTRRLLSRYSANPVFTDPRRPGLWSDEHPATLGKANGEMSPVIRLAQCLQEFQQFKKEFLIPNDFYHTLGVRFQDTSGNYLFALDYQRPKHMSPFGRLEFARAKVITMMLHARAIQLGAATKFHCACSDLTTDHAVNGTSNGQWHDLDNEHSGKTADQRLSARELEVVQLVSLGLTNKEVSNVLGISVRTVENHIRSIFKKLDVKTRTRLAAKLHDVRART